jgi:hypothetical protein
VKPTNLLLLIAGVLLLAGIPPVSALIMPSDYGCTAGHPPAKELNRLSDGSRVDVLVDAGAKVGPRACVFIKLDHRNIPCGRPRPDGVQEFVSKNIL